MGTYIGYIKVINDSFWNFTPIAEVKEKGIETFMSTNRRD